MNIGGFTTEVFYDRLSVMLALILGLGIGSVVLEAILYWLFARVLKLKHALAFTLLAPAAIALTLFTVYPLVFNVQLAFSDLRIRTLSCYAPSGSTNVRCPMENPQVGQPAKVSVDKVTLRVAPGDDQQAVVDVSNGTTLHVLDYGSVPTPAAPAAGTAGSQTGGFNLGVPLPGQSAATPVAPVAPVQAVDGRTWWKVQTDSGQVGWIPDSPLTDDNIAMIKKDPVLYSLDYGLANFRNVFFDTDPKTGAIIGWGRLITEYPGSTFPVLFARTILWTLLNVFFHLLIGFGLALLLNGKLRFKGIYRTIILIPWAVPQVIAALTWHSEFHSQYGFVNLMLAQFGVDPISWLKEPVPAFIAVLFVNIWLGVPFYMVVLLGGLGSISREYYEAAEMDGAGVFDRFRHITVPLIRPVAVPILTLDAVWTFNMFNVIYLMTEGDPAGQTNILVTALYNSAFGKQGAYRLGFAAAFSILIFMILLGMTVIWVRNTGALKGVYD
ncbi:MAG TPA: ABC transporter permease subunit [Aggregatilineales bacterium]|nr:ABC transporter permease subunit [Aggregatilineales bacterium]